TQYLIKKMELSSVDGYELTLLDGGTVFFRFNRATSGSSYSLSSPDGYPSDGNTWVRIAATYDGAGMRIYTDGYEAGARALSSAASIKVNALRLTIGGGTGGAHSFQGSMDDVRIYNVALGASDIQALAETPPPPQGAP